jgi:hypothetical protein
MIWAPINKSREKPEIEWLIIFIAVGASLFYLPFISRQFMGDDWLWLSNAKKALLNPAIYFQRPMYGYLRPLNMIVISILYKIVGLNSYIFSLGNVFLHAANIILLSEVLKKFNVEKRIRISSTFIFAFYYLNAPVIAWVATGHDIWVTLLSLLFVFHIFKVFKKPSLGGFLLAWTLAFSAVLFKESGFVTLGLYFLIAIYMKRSPFSGKLKFYTAFFILSFTAYLIYYAATRTYADKQLDFGVGTIINLWYFLTYMIVPLSKRITDMIPTSLIYSLKYIKIVLTISIPIVILMIIKKGPSIVKFFLMWVIMYLSTIAIMKWNTGLFNLYPEETAGRFFYTVDIGTAVILAWLLIMIYDKTGHIFRKRKFLIAVCSGIFIALNLGIIYKTTQIYLYRQSEVNNIMNDLGSISNQLANGDTLSIIVEKKYTPPEDIVESEPHIQAIIFMKFDKIITVDVTEETKIEYSERSTDNSRVFMLWNPKYRHLIIPKAGNHTDF